MLTFALLSLLAAFCLQLFLLLPFCFQDALVFPGSYFPLGFHQQDDVTPLRAQIADGRSFRIAHAVPAAGRKPAAVLVYFNGNAEAYAASQYWARKFADWQGCEVFSPEYPGYGDSGGRAAKRTCLEAAELTLVKARARARALGCPLMVGGHSLGTFMAAHLAAQGGVDKLLLTCPPTSIAACGKELLPYLPVDMILLHDFDSLALARRIRCPTLILHGDPDPIVPKHHGARLGRAIAGAEFRVVPGGGHDPNRIYNLEAARVTAFFGLR